ncbi:MAG TPA: response regulator [Actinomycetes bacterium]|jgi:response regulator NasT|nr:response regulator [Actinomycetes bacterium]
MARVLVAEDEVLIRVDVVETLEEGGHTVVGEAGDGEQAVRLARELNPDLVVMDVKMPKMDGVAAARHITQDGLAVLVLTAFSDKQLVEEAADAGSIGYLVKPFQPAQLLAAVEVALARAADARKLQGAVEDLETKLADRKVIERAKGRLMEQFGLTEDQAYTRMRKAAMDRQLPLVEIARRVLESQPSS